MSLPLLSAVLHELPKAPASSVEVDLVDRCDLSDPVKVYLFSSKLVITTVGGGVLPGELIEKVRVGCSADNVIAAPEIVAVFCTCLYKRSCGMVRVPR